MPSIGHTLRSLFCCYAPQPQRTNMADDRPVTAPANNTDAPLTNNGQFPQPQAQQHTESFLDMVLPERRNGDSTMLDAVIKHHETDATAKPEKGKSLPADDCYKAMQKLTTDDERRTFALAQPQWLSELGVPEEGSASTATSASAVPKTLSIHAATQLAYALPYLPNTAQKQQALVVLEQSATDIAGKLENGKEHADASALSLALARSAHAMQHDHDLPLQKHLARLVRALRDASSKDATLHIYELPRLRATYNWAKQDMFNREIDLKRIRHAWSAPEGSNDSKKLKLESEIVDLPEDFHEVEQQVEELNFRFPRFKEMPVSVFKLTNLCALELTNNDLEFLSEDISKLQNLEKLNLHGHRLKALPDGIGELQNLRDLNVSDGQLESLPASLGKLQSLALLDISHNKISAIPEGICAGPFIRCIVADYNKISTLPTDFRQFPPHSKLDIAHNDFSPDYIAAQKKALYEYTRIRWSN